MCYGMGCLYEGYYGDCTCPDRILYCERIEEDQKKFGESEYEFFESEAEEDMEE